MYPNYRKNIKNIASTFSKFLGKENGSTLKILEKEIQKKYKNVVFIIFDGMGVDVLKKIGKDTILNQNIKMKLTSVFPSTTTNATTTMSSNSFPSDHKWIGWSVFFKELNRCVDLYLDSDSYTNEKVESVFNIIPHQAFYNTFKTNTEIYTVFPSFVKEIVSKNNYVADNLEQIEKNIIEITNKNEDKFVYAYSSLPDSTMHQYGVTSSEAEVVIKKIDALMKNLVLNCPNTLFVISADHGHIDVSGYVEIYKNEKLMNMLARPLSLESRAASIVVKPEFKKEFLKEIKQYKKDFKLISVQKLIRKNVFGNKIDSQFLDFLGEYILVGTKTNKQLVFEENRVRFKGHHGSLTKNEMTVPLIIINSHNNKKVIEIKDLTE